MLLTMDVIGRVTIVIQSLISAEPPLHEALATRQCPLYMFTRRPHKLRKVRHQIEAPTGSAFAGGLAPRRLVVEVRLIGRNSSTQSVTRAS